MFITYKITNVITGKYYIGSHKTNDPYDDYMGSGKWIRDSIQKYGIENHKKEILGIFETRKESIDLEHRLIVEKRKSEREALLNANTGGFSFDYINENLSFDRAAFTNDGLEITSGCSDGFDSVRDRIDTLKQIVDEFYEFIDKYNEIPLS